MADPTQPACREWLGLEPGELAFPHCVLGVPVDERDMLTIVRAADRRLAILRDVPSDRSAERDALTAQVEAARDAMLAVAMRPPVPGAVTPPPPPPTAAVTFPSAPEPASEAPFPVVRGPAVPPRRSGGGAGSLGTAAILLAIAGLTLYIAWPHVQRSLQQLSTRPLPNTRPQAGLEPRLEPAVQPAPDAAPQTASRPAARPAPATPPGSTPTPPGSTLTVPGSTPTVPAMPQPVAAERVREQVGAAVTRAFAVLVQHDYATAKRELESVMEAAHDDKPSATRLQRWELLVRYAEQYPTLRARALADAEATTLEEGARVISVVGITDDIFVYRDSLDPGRNLRFPLDKIPADVEGIVVRGWLAAGGKASNHLFLGAAALARPTPDLIEARREWQTAATKGEDHGRLLLELLEDPAVRGAPAVR